MSTSNQTPDIDLSAGFVPKTAPPDATTASPTELALRSMRAKAPVSLSSADVEFEDSAKPSSQPIDLSAGFVPKTAKPSGGLPKLSSSDVEFEQPQEKPGFLKGVYDTTLGPMVDIAKREGKYLADANAGFSRTPQNTGILPTPDENDPLVQAIHGIVKSHADVAHKALEALRQGRYSEAAGYGAATALPVLGPAAAKAGEDIGKGNVRYGLGEGTGLVGSVLAAGGGKTAAERPEPIPGAPLTPGEARGGLLKSGEQLVSKVGSAQKPVREFMGDRTAAITDAANKVAPITATPEEAGANVQDAARAVTHGKEQAGELVDQFGERAKQELDTAKQTAADSEKAQTQAEAERQGTELQKTAAQGLDRRRVASIAGAQDIAKDISGGQDELPVPEADRKIIDSLRSGNQAAKSEESAAHEALTETAKDRGIVVDTKPMQDVAKGVVQLEGPARDLVTSSLPSSVLKMLEKASEGEAANSPLDPYAQSMTGHNYVELKSLAESPPTGKAATRGAGGTDWKSALQNVEKAAATDGVEPMEAGVPYDVMKTGRTAVRESLQGARKHFQQTGMGGNAVRVLQELYGSMSDAMKKSLEPHADLAKQFNEANALTVDRTSKFVDPKFIPSLVYKGDSAKVVGAVMRSGGQVEANALVNALGKDAFAMGPLKRAAMDFTLRRSMKTPSGELPGTVEASKMDYDLAVRNAERTPALQTILGDDGYKKFLGDLENKRLAARDPDEVRFEGQLQRIVKADMPEKAAKLGADQNVAGKLAQNNPAVQSQPIDTTTGQKAVSWAERRLAGAKSASERLSSPTLPEKGVQKVARSVSEEIAPSKIIEHAAKEPEYTDKLLEVIDRSPNPQQMRDQLGQRIFRNALDNSMVQGAFGSSGGIADVGKFGSDYSAARPSLAKILPPENVKAMDGFADALKQYTLSSGVGQAGGMSSRMLVVRQIMAVSSLISGLLTMSPHLLAGSAMLLAGPKIWMELATHPAITQGELRAGKTAAAGIAIAANAARQSPESGNSQSAVSPLSQPAPAATAPGQRGKTVAKSIVQSYAATHKVGSRQMTYDEAVKGFQSKGYTIAPEVLNDYPGLTPNVKPKLRVPGSVLPVSQTGTARATRQQTYAEWVAGGRKGVGLAGEAAQ